MSAASNAFARVTREHRLVSLSLPPCANYLYLWLLAAAPAGQPAEIYLEEFQAENQNRFGGRGYTLSWIKQSLAQLIDRQLVDVVYKFSSKVFKLVTWHPDRCSAQDLKKSSETTKKTCQNPNKSSRSQASNADSPGLSYREFKETTNKPTHHPVAPSQQGKVIGCEPERESPQPETQSSVPPAPAITPEVQQQLEASGFKLNTTLTRIVRQTAAQIVLKAIAAVQQYQATLQQKKQPLRRQPEALLVCAIRQQWQPQSSDTPCSPMPPEFDRWFAAAKTAGLVQASSIQADVTQHEPGVLCVLSISQGWQPFAAMLRCFPLAEVEEMAAQRLHRSRQC